MSSNCPHCKAENDAPNIKIDSDNGTEGDNYEVECQECDTLYFVTYTVTEQSWCRHPDHVWKPWMYHWETAPEIGCTKECEKCGAIMTQALIDSADKYYREASA